MSTIKAPVPAFLKSLIQAFEASKEAQSFIVTPPPHAGLAYEFTEPYFHAHNTLMVNKQVSEELHMLVAALQAALTTYMAYYTQLKHPASNFAVMLTHEDQERYGIALGARLQPLQEGSKSMKGMGWYPNSGAGTMLGLRTELGIFPFGYLDDLQAKVNTIRFRQSASGILGTPGTPFARENPSLYGGYGFQGLGGYRPFAAAPAGSSFLRPLPTALSTDTDEVNVPDSAALSRIFNTLLKNTNEFDVGLARRVRAYVESSRETDALSEQDATAVRDSLMKELTSEEMSWKAFCKGLKILGLKRTMLSITGFYDDDGEISANVWFRQDEESRR